MGVGVTQLNAFRDCQKLTRRRLSKSVLRLFSELTGLRLNTLWHPAPGAAPGETRTFFCPAAWRVINSSRELPHGCRTCLTERWHAAASRPGEGLRFVGRCGATSLCVSIEAAGVTPVSLVLQACITGGQMEPRERVASGSIRQPPISPERFHQAESLLRLMVADLENRLRTRLAARLAHAAGPGAEQSARGELPLPAAAPHRLHITIALPRGGHTGGQAAHLVQTMLDYAHEYHRQPMALKEIAVRLNRNPNYLSGLFHLATGTGFHHYVESLRLARAEALLRDPFLRVRDVARSTGYLSPNHFRAVFKSRNGLCPTAWRMSSRSAPARGPGT